MNVKRSFDVLMAFLALVVFLPVFLILTIAIAIAIGNPVLFVQSRPGKDGRPFKLIKFRTMTDARSPDGSLLKDSERMTQFGRILRSTSLDEIPELWNVLTGDMSLVGPRPLLMEYLTLYTPEQFRRHEVRPGITGWAQVKGRNSLSWDERFALDLWYIENRSFWLDLEILARTIIQVVKRDGISHGSEATMPRFNGRAK